MISRQDMLAANGGGVRGAGRFSETGQRPRAAARLYRTRPAHPRLDEQHLAALDELRLRAMKKGRIVANRF